MLLLLLLLLSRHSSRKWNDMMMMMMMMMLTGLSSKVAEGKSNTHRLLFSPRRREHEPGRARLPLQADHALRGLC